MKTEEKNVRSLIVYCYMDELYRIDVDPKRSKIELIRLIKAAFRFEQGATHVIITNSTSERIYVTRPLSFWRAFYILLVS